MTATEEDGSSAGMVSQRAHIIVWRPLRTQLPICMLNPAWVNLCPVSVSLWQRWQGSQRGQRPDVHLTGPCKTLTQQGRGSHIQCKLPIGVMCARSWLSQPGFTSCVRGAKLVQAIRGCTGIPLHCKMAMQTTTVQCNG